MDALEILKQQHVEAQAALGQASVEKDGPIKRAVSDAEKAI